MKLYVLKDENQRGNVYFKGYSPYVQEVEWTGVLERACFWKAWDCANEQAVGLNMKEREEGWTVVEVDF